MRDRIFQADRGARVLFACVCAETRFIEPAVADSRLGAALRPYRDEPTARAALEAAGGTNVRPAP